jgi:hypothetical protein
MLIIFKSAHDREGLTRVERVAAALGGEVVTVPFDGAAAALVSGAAAARLASLFESLPGVAAVLPVAAALRHTARRGP